VRIINTFGVGTTTDTVARVISEDLQRRLGKAFIVESKVGAAGMIGAAEVARSDPDGYTLGVSNPGPLANNVLLYKKKIPFDPLLDLQSITLAVHQPCTLVVNNQVPANNLQELVAELKRNPGKYNYAQIGAGGASNLLMALIAARSGAEVVQIGYNGSGEAMLAVVRGDAQMGCLPSMATLGQVKGGKLRALAISTPNRAPMLPDVPTLQEQGMPGAIGSAWIGIVVARGTPKALVDRINKEVVTALRRPEAVEMLAKQMMEVVANTPEEFDAFRREEVARWKPVVERYNISVD
jgi:tripartite-type tricarboxylate transporter receptor subunit TctC